MQRPQRPPRAGTSRRPLPVRVERPPVAAVPPPPQCRRHQKQFAEHVTERPAPRRHHARPQAHQHRRRQQQVHRPARRRHQPPRQSAPRPARGSSSSGPPGRTGGPHSGHRRLVSPRSDVAALPARRFDLDDLVRHRHAPPPFGSPVHVRPVRTVPPAAHVAQVVAAKAVGRPVRRVDEPAEVRRADVRRRRAAAAALRSSRG